MRVDIAMATIELTENRDAAPLFEMSVPGEAVLADSEISVGVAPFVKALPHVEARALEADPGSKPAVCIMLKLCLTQSEQVTLCGRWLLPEMKPVIIPTIVDMSMMPTEVWTSVNSSGTQRSWAVLFFKQPICLRAG